MLLPGHRRRARLGSLLSTIRFVAGWMPLRIGGGGRKLLLLLLLLLRYRNGRHCRPGPVEYEYDRQEQAEQGGTGGHFGAQYPILRTVW